LDRVLWIPVGSPPHKPHGAVAPGGARLAMVQAAVAGDSRFEADPSELRRPGPSYTVDTVRALRHRFPGAEIFLILGSDQVAQFKEWRDPEGILEHVRLAVMDRGGESATAAARSAGVVDKAVVVPVRRVDVSSTRIRALRGEGRDIGDLVPDGVREIIERERLYSGP